MSPAVKEEKPRLYPDSEVEVRGFMARHYDLLMNLMTLGYYPVFLRKALGFMDVKPGDRILDLGAGNGRNDAVLVKRIGPEGRILGLDIGEEMMAAFRKRFAGVPNVEIREQRIDAPFDLGERFDHVLISFVLHGFPHEVRPRVLENAWNHLREGGSFWLLDYNEFTLSELPWFLRTAFKKMECPYAFDFIEKDWKAILKDLGLEPAGEKLFFRRMVRMLRAVKETPLR